jgi:hypothetical protein
MQTLEVRSAGTCVNDNGNTGTNPEWTSTSNATVSDNLYAQVVLTNDNSEWLKCTSFGFAIPNGTLISWAEVRIEGNAAGANCVVEEVFPVISGIVSDNAACDLSDGELWIADAGDVVNTFQDVCGAPWCNAVTCSPVGSLSVVNTAGFGAALAVHNLTGTQATCSVDLMQIAICHDGPTPTPTPTITHTPTQTFTVSSTPTITPTPTATPTVGKPAKRTMILKPPRGGIAKPDRAIRSKPERAVIP